MSEKILIRIAVILLFYSRISVAQNGSPILQKERNINSVIHHEVTWYQMFSDIPKDEYNFAAENISQDKIPTYFSIALLTGALISFDHNSWENTRNITGRSPFLKKFSDYTVMLGNGGIHFIFSGMFAVYGLFGHDETAIKTASNITEAVLATGLFVQLLKRLTGRESPAAATSKTGVWDLFPSITEYQGDQAKFYSFPSGHLATATATLTVIANNYPDEKWIKPVGYSILGLLGLSLVSKGMHWYSDLPLAFLIGNSMGNIISPVPDKNGRLTSKNVKGHLALFPSIGKNTAGLNMVYSF